MQNEEQYEEWTGFGGKKASTSKSDPNPGNVKLVGKKKLSPRVLKIPVGDLRCVKVPQAYLFSK